MIKHSLFLILYIVLCFPLSAQLTLEECQREAQENYPLVRQYRLIEQAENFSLSNAAKGNLPQLSLSGKASYQSDATTLPFDIPGTDFHGMPKDQYQIMAEISQNIWDGGNIQSRKQQIKATSEEAERQLDVSMYALRQRVNQVFFGIILLDEQLNQNTLLNEELKRNLHDVSAYRDNGIANDADVDAVRVEILNTRQQRIALESSRATYIRMLALLTGKELTDSIRLTRPQLPDKNNPSAIHRPELRLYDAQEQTLDVRRRNLRTGYLPRFSLFAQGAYGNPGLNMLKDSFEPYFIVGARMNWNFGSLYTLKNDKRKLETERQQITSNRDLFLFNTRLQLAEQEGKLNTLQRQMAEDDEIIRMRTNIRRAAEAKVANGTLSVNEMLRELTAESLARQTKVQHEVQLLMEAYERKHLTN